MRSLNRVMLIGHLAADVDFRQTKNEINVASFPLATNRFVKDEDEKREIADFHKIIAWGKLAEICNDYLEKGMAVFVEGKVVNRSFDDKEGNRHFRTEIVAENINILTWKKDSKGKGNVEVKSVQEEEAVAA